MMIDKERYLPRMLSVLEATSKKYRDPVRPLGCDSSGSMVAYTTYMVENITRILDIPALRGMMGFERAVSTLLPFLEQRYRDLGFDDYAMWKTLSINGDKRLTEAWNELKVVCNK